MKRKFRYSLDALLKKRRWELDSLRAEEQAARGVREQHQAECAVLTDTISAVEAELRSEQAPDRPIRPELYQVLGGFLRHKRESLTEAQERLASAEREHEDAVNRVVAMKQSLRALERHREAKENEFRTEQDREAIRASDELWILRSGTRRS